MVRRIDLVAVARVDRRSRSERRDATNGEFDSELRCTAEAAAPHPPTVALDAAIRVGDVQAASAAIAAGAELDLKPWQDGRTRLEEACRCPNSMAIIDVLVAAGADLNRFDGNRRTLAHTAELADLRWLAIRGLDFRRADEYGKAGLDRLPQPLRDKVEAGTDAAEDWQAAVAAEAARRAADYGYFDF